MRKIKNLTNLQLVHLLLELRLQNVVETGELSKRLTSKKINIIEAEIQLRSRVRFEF